MTDQQSAIVMEEVLDPKELAKARAQDERYKRNFTWFQAHAAEIVANASASLAKSCSSRIRLRRPWHRPWRHIRMMMAASCITFQSRKSHVSMRIDGEWALFDDGVERPIIAGDIQAGNEAWIKVPFLVDK